MNESILEADDERLSEMGTVSRFRPRYRSLNPDELNLHDAIKLKADELCDLIERTLPSRERFLAVMKLEEAIMWAIKGLTGDLSKASTDG